MVKLKQFLRIIYFPTIDRQILFQQSLKPMAIIDKNQEPLRLIYPS